MKKFLSLLLVAVLVSAMFAVPVSADDEYFWAEGEYTTDESGNWHPNNAWGYVFNIDSLNTLTVDGNSAITGIFTNVEDYLANAGGKNAKWKAHVILAPTEEANVYEVVQGYEYTGKTAQEAVNEGIVNFDGGKIILMASDSGTRPDKNDDGALLFPNWEDRAACWGLVKTIGAKLTLAGVDLEGETGACTGTLTVEADPSKVEDDKDDEEVISLNLIDPATPWEVTGNGSFSYEGDVLTVNAVENWPCIQAYYAEAITVTVADYYLVYDFTVEGATNMNFIFGNGGTFSISNSALSLEEGQFDANSGDIFAGSYKGVIALSDLVAATANYQSAAFPAAEVVDGELTFAGLNIFSVGTDVDVVVNKLALVTEVEGDEEVIEITNVALDKEYEISGLGALDSYYGDVTDGFVAENLGENKNAEWFGFYHNGDRPTNAPDKLGYFIIDLEDTYTLTSARVHMTNMTAWGIVPPEAVTAYVSLDGNAYEEIGSFEGIIADDDFYWVNLENINVKAKYVKIEVKLGGTFAFVSEVEIYGGKGVAGGSTEEPKEDLEALLKEALGEAPADAKLDFVIDAPETYEAGDDITVTVTVKNITAETGIHVVEFVLYYDNEKLLLTNDLDEDDNNAVLCVENLPDKWENFSRVNNDGGENSEDGTVLPLNDGVIIGSILTDNPNAKYAVKEDDVIVFTFNFKVLEDAEGDIGLVIPHAEAEGAINTDTGADVYEANGDYAVIKAPAVVDPDTSKPDDTKPGDASNMIIFAIIAIVALAGSAVVIKTRR